MINGATDFISLMKTLVSSMTPIVTIDTNVAEGTNWRLTMCRTYWLMVGAKIVLNGVTYTIIDVVDNESILVSGASQPMDPTYQLAAPEFWYSSHRKVNSERKNKTDIRAPFVYLPIYEVVEDHNEETDISYTATIRPLFLASFDQQKDTIELQESLVIKPMNNMATLFNELIDSLDQTFNEPESITRKDWMNFGNQLVWGNDELIFDQPLSGVELRMDLPVLDENLCECDGEPFKVCSGVTILLNGSFNQVVDDGGTYDCVTGGGSINIDINGTSYLVGVSTNQDIPVVDTDENPVGSDNGGLWEIAGNVITFNGSTWQTLLAEENFSFTVQDEDGNNVGTIINPTTIEVPNAPKNTANHYKTGQTTSYRTGDNPTVGRGVSWLVLDHLNGFGANTNRFTDQSGGQTYADDIVVDWAFWDQVNGTVPMWYRIPTATSNWNAAIDGAVASTVGGYSDWRLNNMIELLGVCEYEIPSSQLILLNYAPFNIDVNGQGERLWCSDRAESSRYQTLIENGNFQAQASTANQSYIYTRLGLLTDLGL